MTSFRYPPEVVNAVTELHLQLNIGKNVSYFMVYKKWKQGEVSIRLQIWFLTCVTSWTQRTNWKLYYFYKNIYFQMGCLSSNHLAQVSGLFWHQSPILGKSPSYIEFLTRKYMFYEPLLENNLVLELIAVEDLLVFKWPFSILLHSKVSSCLVDRCSIFFLLQAKCCNTFNDVIRTWIQAQWHRPARRRS